MTHDILDPFGETRLVAVTKDLVVPMHMYRELVELNIILDNLLVVLHLQVIDCVFGIGGRVYGAKLGSEGADEGGPVVHPYRIFIVFQEGGFEEF